MAFVSRKKFKLITVTYWLLLLYIVAALIWWFISLEKQNREMKELRYKTVYALEGSINPDKLKEQIASINNDTNRNNRKYIAEGVTFFILILIGASFVYRAVRRQFRMQYQQENFMMAVTHELKTPIAVAKLNLETLLKHHLDADKQKKIIQMTLNETGRLNSLTNNILVSSQLEGDGNGFTKDELDFTSLVNDCIQEARNRYPERIFKEQIEPGRKCCEIFCQRKANNLYAQKKY
jgi:signal transduction histidine kinase